MREVIDSDDGKFVAGRIARLEGNRAEAEKQIAVFRAAGNEAMAKVLERYREDVPVIVEEYRHIENLPPTATFENKLTLHRGARTIDLLFFGRGDVLRGKTYLRGVIELVKIFASAGQAEARPTLSTFPARRVPNVGWASARPGSRDSRAGCQIGAG